MAYCELTLRSTALDMDVKVDVILPENRHHTQREDKKYPVLYILHGYKEDNSTWGRLSNLPLYVRDLPLVVCIVSCYNGFYMNHHNGGMQLDTWIAEELPVKLANYFPVSTEREDTYIMGESMGGFGTMHLALTHPDKYGHACVLSAGAMNSSRFFSASSLMGKRAETVFGPAEEFETSTANLTYMAKKVNDSEGPKPEFQFYCGTEDGGYEGCVKTVEFFKNECPNIPLINTGFWHGKHDFYFWNQAIPKALEGFGFDVYNVDAAI